MADPVAVWGAVTGTVATFVAARRELVLNRARLGIEHGVHFLLRDPPAVQDAWLLIRVWNRGGQPLTVERVGLRYFPTWTEAEGREIHVSMAEGLAEIELEGVGIELAPGGPSRSLYAPLRALPQAGIDILGPPVWAWARTSDTKEWTGAMHPVVPARVPENFRALFQDYQDAVGVTTDTPFVHVGLPNEGPLRGGGIEA